MNDFCSQLVYFRVRNIQLCFSFMKLIFDLLFFKLVAAFLLLDLVSHLSLNHLENRSHLRNFLAHGFLDYWNEVFEVYWPIDIFNTPLQLMILLVLGKLLKLCLFHLFSQWFKVLLNNLQLSNADDVFKIGRHIPPHRFIVKNLEVFFDRWG